MRWRKKPRVNNPEFFYFPHSVCKRRRESAARHMQDADLGSDEPREGVGMVATPPGQSEARGSAGRAKEVRAKHSDELEVVVGSRCYASSGTVNS